MNYVIKLGDYYFQSSKSYRDKDFIGIQLTKNIQGAVWYGSEDDANEWAEKIGGKVISFEIDVKEKTQ